MSHVHSPWLQRFAAFHVLATLFLVFAGSLVTSTTSGLAVPDWPLSFGQVFPKMEGGVFYEHGHRMIASVVGVLTIVLALWLAVKETRRWVKVLGWTALAAVIAQGVLGGLTVLYYLPVAISVTHGIVAQSFLLLVVLIAYSQLAESKGHQNVASLDYRRFFRFAAMLAVVVYLQLVLGAIMRHSGAGLAIYDFPLHLGSIVPGFDADTVAIVDAWHRDRFLPYTITSLHIALHFAHRMLGYTIGLGVLALFAWAWPRYRMERRLRMPLVMLLLLVAIQITLGAATVLTEKLPYVASFHVLTGAALLALCGFQAFRAYRLGQLISGDPA